MSLPVAVGTKLASTLTLNAMQKNVSQATLAGSASFSVTVMEVQMQLATATPESASTVALPSDGVLAAF